MMMTKFSNLAYRPDFNHRNDRNLLGTMLAFRTFNEEMGK